MVTKTKQAAGTGEQQALARVIKEAMKSGKYTVGTKEVISELKSAKLVLAAAAVSGTDPAAALVKEAEKVSVPVVRVGKSSAELGKMLGRPYRVSAVALRVVAEVDLRQLVGSPPRPPKVAE